MAKGCEGPVVHQLVTHGPCRPSGTGPEKDVSLAGVKIATPDVLGKSVSTHFANEGTLAPKDIQAQCLNQAVNPILVIPSPSQPGPPLPVWKDLFSPSNNPDSSLEYFEPQIVDGVKRARLPPEEVAKGAKLWEFSLVAFLVGKKLPGRSVKDILAKKWGKVGHFSVHIVENGVFIVKFEQGQARDWVLDNGPWDVWGYHLVLRKWSLGMSLTLGGCKTMPVWVKLMGVPLQYWTKTGLSHIASVLGRPLYMDACTTSRYALSYTRICVEMDASSSFPHNITLDLGNRNTMDIGVEYPWKPASCSLCQVFEHSNRNCPRAINRVWMPKPDVLAMRKPDDAEGWITVKRKGSKDTQPLASLHEETLPVFEAISSAQNPSKQGHHTTPTNVDRVRVGPANEGKEEDENRPVAYKTDLSRVLLVGSSSSRKKKKKKGQGGLGTSGRRSSK
ncbi:DUF4283 domain-containing protein [Cephalotus follicularis]|uniref:DUF4283 domain-containing protein n=1 Tax=Cephalotus follicularis TaxID=3775 RepID=A0A1Q3DJQ4_CEPFO|nr:DUF4283 domain-containing protein [Cephalotus follicularis]